MDGHCLSHMLSRNDRPSNRHPYLLRDLFGTPREAGAVNATPSEPVGGLRTVTDTNGKISIIANGVLNVATGAANFDGVWYPSMIRKLGRTVIGTVIPSETVNFVLRFGWDIDIAGNVADALILGTGGILSVTYNATTNFGVGAYTAAQYRLCVIERENGAFFLIRGGVFEKWTLLAIVSLGNTNTIYPAANISTATVGTLDNFLVPSRLFIPYPIASDSFAGSDGSMTGRLTDGLGQAESGGAGLAWETPGNTWTIASNAAVNTPTQGAEMFTDPGLEGNYTAGLNDNLTKIGSPIVSQSADVHGGSKAQEFTGVAANDRIQQAQTLIVGTWYRASCWAKRTVIATNRAVFNLLATPVGSNLVLTDAAYTQKIIIERATITGGSVRVAVSQSTLCDTVIVDDVSLTALSISSCFSSLFLSTVNVTGEWVIKTLVPISQAGCVLRLDDPDSPANFLILYWDGSGNIKLDECVAGVYTNKMSVVKAYATGDKLVPWLSGSAWRIYHVTAAGVATLLGSGTTTVVTGNYVGNFNTYEGNAIESCNVFAVGNEGQWEGLSLL